MRLGIPVRFGHPMGPVLGQNYSIAPQIERVTVKDATGRAFKGVPVTVEGEDRLEGGRFTWAGVTDSSGIAEIKIDRSILGSLKVSVSLPEGTKTSEAQPGEEVSFQSSAVLTPEGTIPFTGLPPGIAPYYSLPQASGGDNTLVILAVLAALGIGGWWALS